MGTAVAERHLSLRQNFSWTFAGNAVYSASQWGLLVVLAKLGTAEMVGRFALGLAICAPVVMFSYLGLRNVQATDTSGEYRFGDYLMLRLVTTLVAMVVIGAVALAHDWNTASVVLLVGVAKALEAMSDVLYGLFQQHERLDMVARSMLVKGPLSVVLLALGLWWGRHLLGALAGLVLVNALVLLLYDAPRAWQMVRASTRGPVFSPRGKLVARLAWLTLPLGAASAVTSLTSNLPTYFVEHVLGPNEVGALASMVYLTVAGSRVIDALSQSASPRLSRLYRDDRRAFARLLGRLAAIGGGIGLAAVLVAAGGGGMLLTVLYRAEYALYTPVFVWVMAAGALLYVVWFLHAGMTAARFIRVQLWLRVAVALVTAVGCVLLVPRHGLAGAAWAMTIAGAVHLALASFVVRRMVRTE